jgi:hypothetical protein
MNIFNLFSEHPLLSMSCSIFLGPLSISLVFEWFTESGNIDFIEFIF